MIESFLATVVGTLIGCALWSIVLGEASAAHERYIRRRQAEAAVQDAGEARRPFIETQERVVREQLKQRLEQRLEQE